jgi:hypothetical protein
VLSPAPQDEAASAAKASKAAPKAFITFMDELPSTTASYRQYTRIITQKWDIYQ